VAGSRDRLPGIEDRASRRVEPDGAGASLGIFQHRARSNNSVPFESQYLASAGTSQKQKSDNVAGIRYLPLEGVQSAPQTLYGRGREQLASIAPVLLAQAPAGIGAGRA